MNSYNVLLSGYGAIQVDASDPGEAVSAAKMLLEAPPATPVVTITDVAS